jgi:transposase-like protein
VEATNPAISAAEMERMMKVQEVILRAMAGKLKWGDAAEILGVTDRSLRRWRKRYEEHGYDGLYDHRTGRPSPKRIAASIFGNVLSAALLDCGQILQTPLGKRPC